MPWQQELLALRGIKTPLEAETFLNPSSKNLHSPFLMEDMKKIVQRIQKAISSKESIVIYGDYDVDGICSTTILYETLQHLGARVSYYIPSRHEEGYGLNSQAVVSLASIHQLMITVDCGITAHEEVALANNLNMEVIITDHHQLPENPVKAFIRSLSF